MKKSTYVAIANTLSAIDFENKDAIMEELNAEINRDAEKKAAKNAEYDAAWIAVREVLESTASPLTVAEIFESCEKELPQGFTKGRVQYGLTNIWKDVIVKIEGKPNTYRLA